MTEDQKKKSQTSRNFIVVLETACELQKPKYFPQNPMWIGRGLCAFQGRVLPLGSASLISLAWFSSSSASLTTPRSAQCLSSASATSQNLKRFSPSKENISSVQHHWFSPHQEKSGEQDLQLHGAKPSCSLPAICLIQTCGYTYGSKCLRLRFSKQA